MSPAVILPTNARAAGPKAAISERNDLTVNIQFVQRCRLGKVLCVCARTGPCKIGNASPPSAKGTPSPGESSSISDDLASQPAGL